MTTKFLALISVIGLASICLVQGQSPTPGVSPAASPSTAKHRTHKKAEATASPAEKAASPSTAESPAASPSQKKPRSHKKAEATAAAATSPSPAAATAASPSPAEKHARKRKTTAAVAPTVTPSPSPAKKTLADLFKPKTSASASPAAAKPASAKSVRAEAATNATPAPGGGHGLVWVNTDSHIYHKEGSRFYGKTKKGKYVSEADAIKEGDKAAGKGQ